MGLFLLHALPLSSLHALSALPLPRLQARIGPILKAHLSCSCLKFAFAYWHLSTRSGLAMGDLGHPFPSSPVLPLTGRAQVRGCPSAAPVSVRSNTQLTPEAAARLSDTSYLPNFSCTSCHVADPP